MLTTKTKWLILLALLAALMIGGVSYMSLQKATPSSTEQQGDFLGGDFSISTLNGPFNLKDYRGKVVILYFGYASCPDVCPTALALLGNTLKRMPKAMTDQIQPLFISVDPDRDTLDKLDQYGHYFYPNLISGTAKKPIIDALVKQYGAFYSFSELNDSAMGYSVDHTSRLYIIDKNGLLDDAVNHADIQSDLQPMLESTLND